MDDIRYFYTGIPIIIEPTLRKQNRTHKKKRINKKWAKRYGFTEFNHIEDDKYIYFKGELHMNEKTFIKLKESAKLQEEFSDYVKNMLKLKEIDYKI